VLLTNSWIEFTLFIFDNEDNDDDDNDDDDGGGGNVNSNCLQIIDFAVTGKGNVISQHKEYVTLRSNLLMTTISHISLVFCDQVYLRL
jgi:hypothetical protein